MTARAPARETKAVIRGRVERVYYAGPDWSAGRLALVDGGSTNFSGKLYAREGDLLALHGQWVTHPQYGRQFKVRAMEYDMPVDKAGLAAYLADHPDICGIGPVKARVLAEQFGDDFERALIERPGAMAEAARVPVDTILSLRDLWQTNAALNRISTWLASFDLTHHQVASLVRRLGGSAVALLQDNPYLLVREIAGFGFHRIDQIACKMGFKKSHPGRLRAGLVECVEQALDDGSCWVEYNALVDQAVELLAMDELESEEWLADQLEALIAEGKLVEVRFDSVTVVAKPAIWEMEKYLCRVLSGNRPNIIFSPLDISNRLDRYGADLNARQREAVFTALTNMLSLISGGAGSGKTYTIKTILRICNDAGFKTVLAAPTGKAAKRMEQTTGQEAFTIHRLLGYNGEEYRFNESNKLDVYFLIIDELSMTDVPLAWRLFQAVDMDRTTVIMVGDHNQLPPVGPGNVLRDLIKQKVLPTVILEEIVRQAGVLKENCTAILSGRVPRMSDRDASGRRPWMVFDDLSQPDHIPRFICDIYDQVLAQKLGYDLIRDVQVLTPTHKGPLGTRALNVLIQSLLQRKLYGVDVPPGPPDHRPKPLVHDKVMQTRNNYDLGVMNGAVGIIRAVSPDGTTFIEFDGEVKVIPAKSQWLRNIELAYACTVHRTQGSEFPCVIAIVHKEHTYQHHRNLLYTAVTRARDMVIILGDDWGIRECARRQKVSQRDTFLSFWSEVEQMIDE